MQCGLLGRTLGHSYSPQIHRDLGGYSYELFEKEPEQLKDFLRNGTFTGLNVTIPYKKTVIPFLDALSPTAQKMGCVNTIVRREDGSLYGHNSDFFGFQSLVRHSGIAVNGRKALVLGSGGASNTAVRALEELGASPVVISRSGENHYGNLYLHKDAAIIVNATPLGMYPNTGVSPLDLSAFAHLEGVLDVIYNPARTKLLLDAERLGIPNENGLWMLVAQAKESAEYFTGISLDDSRIETIYRKLRAQMQNIILIGMPGCGKSTIGAALAKRLNRPLVDADEQIVSLARKSIPDIFAQDGEDVFRTWETKALEDVGKQSGRILATGGGCVTRKENYPLLHQNGTIVFLRREISLLPKDGRPLSQRSSLDAMYRTRRPLYEAFADFTVDNNGTPEETVNAIIHHLEETP